MHERPGFLEFHFSRQGVHFSARFFLDVLHLPRLPGPPPEAAAAVPASSRGACAKSKLRPHLLDGTALSLRYPCKKNTTWGLPDLHISDLAPAHHTPSTLSTLHALDHLI